MRKQKWITWDCGNGMVVCPEEVKEALIPNVAAFQSEICRVKPNPDLQGSDWDAAWEEQKANAYLIAAAPELLDALQLVRDERLAPGSPLYKMVTSVLNKALGKEDK